MAIKYTGGFKTFTFKQQNSGGGEPPMHTFAWVTAAGQIFAGNENTSINTSVQASDSLNLTITYSLANATTLPSGVSLASNGSITGTLPEVVGATDFNFQIAATNGDTTIYRAFSINVVNIDATPVWSTPSGSVYSGNENTSVTANVVATSTKPITYSLTNSTTMPSGVIFSNTGAITGTLPLVNATTVYNFTARATSDDGFVDRDFSLTSVNINESPVWSTPAGSLYVGNENTGFSANVVATVTNGLPITYSLANSSLPGGVTFSNAGMLAGVLPIVNSTTVYNFTARAETTEGFAERAFSFTSNNVVITPVWSTPSGQIYSGNENTVFSANVVATVGGGLPITYSLTNATTLPSGVTLSNAGQVAGTLPIVNSTTSYNFTVRAATTEANADRNFSIQSIQVPAIPVWTTPAGSFYSDNENVAFSKNLVATVSDGSTITYALANATTLPSGVNLMSNGLVYGTLPDVANNTTYNFDISATSLEGAANRSFSITSVNVITDPSYNSIWVMSHFDNGVSNAATYVDDGPSHMSLNGDFGSGPFISNTASKFGGSSLYYPTNSSVFPIPYDAGTDFTNGAFTVEMWFNYTNGQVPNRSLFNRGRDSATHATHVFNLTTNASSRLQFYWGSNSMTGTTVILAGTWYHVAITRNAGNVAMYVNGVQETTGSGFSIPASPQGIYPIFIGGNTLNRMNGYIDDLRITKAVRYTGNFTPPVAPFPNS